MSWNRIYALILRHTIPIRRDLDLWADMWYWPFIDTLSWGLASQFLSKNDSEVAGLILSTLIALVLWNVIWRSQSEVGRNLLDEIWNKNLLNMFSTPLTLLEWIVSVLLQSFVKMVLTAGFVGAMIFFLYQANVFDIGWWLLPFILLGMMTGWSTGFIAAGIVIRWGQRMQTIVWVLPGILIPLSAVYYPAEQLPWLLHMISYAIPTSYVFESMRLVLFTNHPSAEGLLISLILNVAYLVLGMVFFVYMFKKSKALNLSRLHN